MHKIGKKNKNGIFMYLFCIFIALGFLAICTQSSFLYPLNTWVDPNCYLTVGKGITQGLVPYRDFFEQKGPFLYFAHALSYLISPKSFLGVYFLESICVGTFLFFAHKILNLYYSHKYSYILIPFLALFALTTRSFSQGDSAEEIMLPFITAGLYFLIRYFKEFYPEKKDIPYNYTFIGGILAGCVFWTKYTAIGFWFAWMMVVFFAGVFNKSIARAFKNCLVFLFGIFVATLPWLIYFGANDSLHELFDAYFYTNLFLYTNPLTLGQRFSYAYSTFVANIYSNIIISILIAVGFLSFVLCKRFIPNIFGKLSLAITVFFTILGVYYKGTGVYPYYFYIFVALLPLVLVPIAKILNSVAGRVREKELFIVFNKLFSGVILAITMLNFSMAYQLSSNTYLIGTPKEALVQYQFAEIINKTENPTLLNYGFLDGGFYFTANVNPPSKYFCKLNLSNSLYPDLLTEHNRMISEKEVDYIVTIKTDYLRDIGSYSLIEENYELVSQMSQSYEFKDYILTYMLYKVKS